MLPARPLRRRRRPRVSVVIASYRWPEALSLSLESALAQSVAELEVLVIEDGEDRASRAVVRGCGDSRVRWLRRRPESGSQSGPNTLGRRRARAPVIAYLGHDDLWAGEHLASGLAALSGDVDLVHAVTLLLGDDDRLLVAGAQTWSPDTFVPPSSVLHWRDSPRIAPWRSPEQTGMPVDHAILVDSAARGARIVASGQPTVFKLPAAWRPDSYRTRDVSPQRRVRAQLAGEPRLGERLLGDARRAGVAGGLPGPPGAGPGVIADYNRRIKGLPARFGPPVTTWTPSPSFPFPGWHPPEETAGVSYAWLAAPEAGLVRLDAPGKAELGVRVRVRYALHPEQLTGVSVELDGELVALSREEGPEGTELTGWLGRPARGRDVDVRVSAPLLAVQAVLPQSSDDRVVGVAVSEIALLQRPG